jgi:hypothetical protein
MRTSTHPYIYTPIPVCKGPPLHHLPMIILISLRQGKLPRLESLCEACADEDIYTPVSLHHAVLVFIYSRYY